MEGYENREQARNLAEEVIDISNYLSEGEHRLEYLNLEIAIIELKEEEMSMDKVSRDITFALENIKSSKETRGRIIFYDEDIEKLGIRQNRIENLLEDIINGKDKDSLYLEFQPKLHLESNKIVGFEALARIRNEELGYVPPLEFIELAEKRMLIYDLGNIIFEKACKFSKKLEERGYSNMNISVNTSAVQIFRDGFVKDIKNIAEKHSVNLRRMDLEITETSLIKNFDLINDKLSKIRDLGISIFIDDFGTGFSSFFRLKRINADVIKIDKHFIDGILKDNEESLISQDIISMVHKLGLAVIAEGVEKEKQKDYLMENKCDIIQGYLISKPLGEDRAIEFLEKWERA